MSDIQRYGIEEEVELIGQFDDEGLPKLIYLSGVVVKYDDHMTICIEQEKELMKAEKRIDELEKVNKYMEQILLSIANRSADKLEKGDEK